jgi:hypothetical protein
MTNLRLCVYLILLSTASCARNTPAQISLCDHDGLILVSPDDVLTPETERQILLHDKEYNDLCA